MKKLKKTVVNIITPSYNQGAFLKQTIESVLSQKCDGILRYWVIDGGSTDSSKKILQSYGNRLSWISEKDRGQTDAINKGLKKILSSVEDDDVVAYINSDDIYVSGAFQHVLESFQQDKSLMWIVGDAQIIDGKGVAIQEPVRLYKKILRNLQHFIWIGNVYPQPSVFLRGKAIKKVGLFSEQLRYVMDYEYWLRMIQTFGYPHVSTQVLSKFRIHGSSKGGTAYKQQFQEEYNVLQQFTHNQFLLFLHKLHTAFILLIYAIVK